MVNRLMSRFPDKQSVVSVFATAAFLVYGWTIISSFWKIPAWFFYLNLSEIFTIYSYSFITNFLESALLTIGLIVLGFFLFDNFWKDGFLAASVITLIVSVGSALLHLRLHQDPNLRESFVNSQYSWWGVTLLIALLLSVFSVRVSWVRNFLEMLADRLGVFLYIYVPLTILSFIFVIIRIFL